MATLRCLSGVAAVLAAGFEQGLVNGDPAGRVGDEVAEEVEVRRTGVRGVRQRVGLVAQATPSVDADRPPC